jgi:hypothetical protein
MAVAGAAIMATTAAATPSWARAVCYEVKEAKETRLFLDIKFHSSLIKKPYSKSGRQDVYDADGKHAYSSTDYKTAHMAVFDGAIVTSTGSQYPYAQAGAHLGGTSYFVRAPGQHGTPIFWDCTSAEVSATPNTFACLATSPGTFSNTALTLSKVKYPDKDRVCHFFEDGEEKKPY